MFTFFQNTPADSADADVNITAHFFDLLSLLFVSN